MHFRSRNRLKIAHFFRGATPPRPPLAIFSTWLGYAPSQLNKGGRLLGWGSNDEGQLGVSWGLGVVPTLVTGLLKTKTIVQVAAGHLHTACLTADGLVFVCGNGAGGRLGGGDTKDKVVPTLVRGELQGKIVPQVAAGVGHTVWFQLRSPPPKLINLRGLESTESSCVSSQMT